MDFTGALSSKKGYSQTKTQASSSKTHLKHNFVDQNHPNDNIDEKILLSQCYQIIQAQENEVDKLTKDNHRKDSIIANLLNRNEKSNKKVSGEHSNEVQRLSNQMMQMYGRYEGMAKENQYLKGELEIKIKDNKKLKNSIQVLEKRLQDKEAQFQQANIVAQKLKEAYQAKIAKLLLQMRKKVFGDVQKSVQKKVPTQNDQEKSFQRVTTFTPTKRQKENNWVDSKKQLIQSSKQRLINTPYRSGTNFITSYGKIFQNPQSSSTRVKESNEKEKSRSKYPQMLAQVRDVQFITDSQDESAVESSTERGAERSLTMEKFSHWSQRKNQKISIQKIVKQCEQKNENENQLDLSLSGSKQKQKANIQFMKIKYGHFFSQLSNKLKRFESAQVLQP